MADSKKPTVVLVCDVPEGNLVRAGLSAKLQLALDLKVVDSCNKAAAEAIKARAKYILVARAKVRTDPAFTELYGKRKRGTVLIFAHWKDAASIITRLCTATTKT